MSVVVSYKNKFSLKSPSNIVFFVGEDFNISLLKKYIPNAEYKIANDILKSKNKKNSIVNIDINSRKTIYLVSIKKKIKTFEVQNLGAKLYILSSETMYTKFVILSDSVEEKREDLAGHFAHGFKLKSYKFIKYKSKKNKKLISIEIVGKNIPSKKNQLKG